MEGNKRVFMPRMKKSLPLENKIEPKELLPDLIRRTDSGLSYLQKENTLLKKVQIS